MTVKYVIEVSDSDAVEVDDAIVHSDLHGLCLMLNEHYLITEY